MKNLYRALYCTVIGLLPYAVSCDKPDAGRENEGEAEPAALEINEGFVQVKAAGGEYAFTYELTNEDGNELKAECDASWIHDIDLSEAGTVSFTADANAATESRITTFRLIYGKISDKITVTQSGVGEGTIEYSFDIQYDIDGPYVRMSVVPEPENTRYYAWYYSKKGMEEALSQSPGVSIEMYLKRVAEVDISNAIYYGSYSGYSTEEAVAGITMLGATYQDFELNGDTGFYGFVCAVSNSGKILSEVTYKDFTTGIVPPSDNRLEVIIDDVNTDRISYTVNTTNYDQYAAMVFAAEDIEGRSDDDLLNMVNGMSDITSYLHFGDFSTTILVGSEDADYYIVVFGYEYGMLTTEVIRKPVHTLTSDPDAIPDFTIEVDKITHFRIQGSVSANPKTALYYTDWCYADEDPETLKTEIRNAAQWYVDNGYYNSLAACMKAICTKGTKTFHHTGLEPETGYRIYAIGINEQTGEFNTEMYFSEMLTTPSQKVSESYIEVGMDKYFDGFDLADAYPSEFSDAEGWAVIPLEITINGDVTDYYYDIYIGDLTDTTYPTDEELILDLEMNGTHNNPLSMSYCYFNETLTLVYFSIDDEDNKSQVVRQVLKMTPDGCSPVSDFSYGVPESAARSLARNFKR